MFFLLSTNDLQRLLTFICPFVGVVNLLALTVYCSHFVCFPLKTCICKKGLKKYSAGISSDHFSYSNSFNLEMIARILRRFPTQRLVRLVHEEAGAEAAPKMFGVGSR